MSEENTASQENAVKTVIVEMEGGVIQNIVNPNPDVVLLVVDTDMDGVPDDERVAFSFGDKEVECTIVEYGSTDPEQDGDWIRAVVEAHQRRYGG